MPGLPGLGLAAKGRLTEEDLAFCMTRIPYGDDIQVAISLGEYNEVDGIADAEIAADQSLVTLRRSAMLYVSTLEDARPIGLAGRFKARRWALCFMARPIGFIPNDRRKPLRQRPAEARQFASWRHRPLLVQNGGAFQGWFLNHPSFSHQKPAFSQSV